MSSASIPLYSHPLQLKCQPINHKKRANSTQNRHKVLPYLQEYSNNNNNNYTNNHISINNNVYNNNSNNSGTQSNKKINWQQSNKHSHSLQNQSKTVVLTKIKHDNNMNDHVKWSEQSTPCVYIVNHNRDHIFNSGNTHHPNNNYQSLPLSLQNSVSMPNHHSNSNKKIHQSIHNCTGADTGRTVQNQHQYNHNSNNPNMMLYNCSSTEHIRVYASNNFNNSGNGKVNQGNTATKEQNQLNIDYLRILKDKNIQIIQHEHKIAELQKQLKNQPIKLAVTKKDKQGLLDTQDKQNKNTPSLSYLQQTLKQLTLKLHKHIQDQKLLTTKISNLQQKNIALTTQYQQSLKHNEVLSAKITQLMHQHQCQLKVLQQNHAIQKPNLRGNNMPVYEQHKKQKKEEDGACNRQRQKVGELSKKLNEYMFKYSQMQTQLNNSQIKVYKLMKQNDQYKSTIQVLTNNIPNTLNTFNNSKQLQQLQQPQQLLQQKQSQIQLQLQQKQEKIAQLQKQLQQQTQQNISNISMIHLQYRQQKQQYMNTMQIEHNKLCDINKLCTEQLESYKTKCQQLSVNIQQIQAQIHTLQSQKHQHNHPPPTSSTSSYTTQLQQKCKQLLTENQRIINNYQHTHNLYKQSQHKISLMEQQIAQLSARDQRNLTQIHLYTKQLQHKQGVISQNVNNIDRLSEQLAAQKQRTSKIIMQKQATIAHLHTQIQSTNVRILDISQQLNKQENRHQELSKTNKQLSKQVAQLRKELKDMGQMRDREKLDSSRQIQGVINKYTHTIQQCQSIIHTLTTQSQTLKQQLSKQTHTLTLQNQQLTQSTTLKAQIQKLLNQNTSLRLQYEQKLKVHYEKYQSANQQLTKVNQLCETQLGKIVELGGLVVSGSKELQQCKSTVMRMQKEKEKHKDKQMQRQKQISRYIDQNKNLSQQLNKIKQQYQYQTKLSLHKIEQLQYNNNNQIATIQQLHNSIKQKQSQIQKLTQTSLKEKQDNIKILKQKQTSFQQKLTELTTTISSLNAQLQQHQQPKQNPQPQAQISRIQHIMNQIQRTQKLHKEVLQKVINNHHRDTHELKTEYTAKIAHLQASLQNKTQQNIQKQKIIRQHMAKLQDMQHERQKQVQLHRRQLHATNEMHRNGIEQQRRTTVVDAQMASQKYRETIKKLQQQLESAAQTIQNNKKYMEDLEQSKCELVRTVDLYKQQLATLQQQHQQLQQSSSSKTAQFKLQISQCRQLIKDLYASIQHYKTIQNNKQTGPSDDQLQIQHIQMQNQYNTLKQQHTQLTQQLHYCKQQTIKKQQQIQVLTNEKNRQLQNSKKHKEFNTKLNRQFEQLSDKHRQISEHNSKLTEQNSHLNYKYKQIEHIIVSYKEQTAKLTVKAQEIQQSNLILTDQLEKKDKQLLFCRQTINKYKQNRQEVLIGEKYKVDNDLKQKVNTLINQVNRVQCKYRGVCQENAKLKEMVSKGEPVCTCQCRNAKMPAQKSIIDGLQSNITNSDCNPTIYNINTSDIRSDSISDIKSHTDRQSASMINTKRQAQAQTDQNQVQSETYHRQKPYKPRNASSKQKASKIAKQQKQAQPLTNDLSEKPRQVKQLQRELQTSKLQVKILKQQNDRLQKTMELQLKKRKLMIESLLKQKNSIYSNNASNKQQPAL